MIHLLFLASVAFGQQNQTIPLPSLNQDSSLQAIQQSMDAKFSVAGGTVTGQIAVSTITRISEICFADGTCQTTAASSSGAGASLTSTQTWSGANNYNSTVTIASGASGRPGYASVPSGSFLVNGSSAAGGMMNTGIGVVWALSKDQATESSGCVVAVYMDSVNPGANIAFTSTSTEQNATSSREIGGVLLEPSCAPNTWCRVGILGCFQVQSSFDAGGTKCAEIGNVRCQAKFNSTCVDGFSIGTRADLSSSTGNTWICLW